MPRTTKPKAKRQPKKSVQVDPAELVPQHVWEKQPEETSQAFEAFAKFRDLGSDRSIRKAAVLVKKSTRLLEGWSRQHAWVLRVDAYDRHNDRIARRVRRQAQSTMLARQATIGAAMQQKAVERLKSLKADELKVGDCVRLLQVGAKLERESRGLRPRDIAPEPDYDAQDEKAREDGVPFAGETLHEAIHVMDQVAAGDDEQDAEDDLDDEAGLGRSAPTGYAGDGVEDETDKGAPDAGPPPDEEDA